MSRINLQSSLSRSGVLMICFILSSLFISENVYSRKHWERYYITFKYDLLAWTIGIYCRFFDYDFGPRGEHGYLEWMDFHYKEEGDLCYTKLMGCEVKDQVQTDYSVVRMTNKRVGAKLRFRYVYFAENGFMWPDYTNIYAKFTNIQAMSHIRIYWLVPPEIKVKHILVTGKWHVNGLNCDDVIKEEVYELTPEMSFVSSKYIDSNEDIVLGQFEDKGVKVFSDADAVVVKGADIGENILVYTSSGILVKSMVVDQDVVNVKLTANQMYIVKVGQECFKIAL